MRPGVIDAATDHRHINFSVGKFHKWIDFLLKCFSLAFFVKQFSLSFNDVHVLGKSKLSLSEIMAVMAENFFLLILRFLVSRCHLYHSVDVFLTKCHQPTVSRRFDLIFISY